MGYKSVIQIAELWGISDRRVRILCQQGKIEGAFHRGRAWLIPENIEKPIDGRTTRHHRKKRSIKDIAVKTELGAHSPVVQEEPSESLDIDTMELPRSVKHEDIVSFNIVCEEFNKLYDEDGDGPEANDTRKKLVELLEVIGLDPDHFRVGANRNGKLSKENVTEKSDYNFHIESVKFLVTILHLHTATDFKKIRKGKFDEVELKTLLFLINGFVTCLINLGYDRETILQERYKMRKHLEIGWHREKDALEAQYQALLADAKSFYNESMDLHHDDKAVLISYITDRLETLRLNIREIHDSYSAIRTEELTPFLEQERPLDLRKLQFQEKLLNDTTFQELVKHQNKILLSDGFISQNQKIYNKTMEQIHKRYQELREEFFEHTEKEPFSELEIVHPLNALAKAIAEVAKDTLETEARKLSVLPDEKRKRDAETEAILRQINPAQYEANRVVLDDVHRKKEPQSDISEEMYNKAVKLAKMNAKRKKKA